MMKNEFILFFKKKFLLKKMSLKEKLEENNRQLANGIIDNKEYQKRKASILSAWTGKPTSTEKTKPSHGR
jgi:hypothetical protein